MPRLELFLVLVALWLAGCASGPTEVSLRFGLLSDAPYTAREVLAFERLLGRMRAEAPAFLLHLGDIKHGSDERCDESLYRARRDLFDQAPMPLVLIPGDNDWTDCRRVGAGGYDPLERLAVLREVMYPDQLSLGAAPMAVARMRGYPEHQRWKQAGVQFVTLHVVGSNNNRGAPAANREADARDAAVRAWLSSAVDEALNDQARALVIAYHASVDFTAPHAAHRPLLDALQAAARRFPRPILLVHGDTHLFRVDQPLPAADGRPHPHVTRIEGFGSPAVGAVLIELRGSPARLQVMPLVEEQ
jgi:hypothetical protein